MLKFMIISKPLFLNIFFKSEIARISKQLLDQINSKLCEILKVNEWKNIASLINWF